MGKLDLDIANFAEQLITANKQSKQEKLIENLKPDGPDYSKVVVPDDYVSKVLGIKEEKTEPDILEEAKSNVTKYLTELANLVARANQIVSEMTTCGMIGVSAGKKKKDKIALVRKTLEKKRK